MLAIAALLDPRQDVREAPVVQLLGAAPLAELMAAARLKLGRERASSRVADAPNSALACGSAPQARVERRR
jgi:hypothetical protein